MASFDSRSIARTIATSTGTQKQMLATAKKIETGIRRETRKRKGGTWAEIKTEGSVFRDTFRVQIEVKGSEPHFITPRRGKKFLVFYWEREGVNFRGPLVDHPGSSPEAPVQRVLQRLGFVSRGPRAFR